MSEDELAQAADEINRYSCGYERCDGDCPSDDANRAALRVLAELQEMREQRVAYEAEIVRLRALVEAAYRDGAHELYQELDGASYGNPARGLAKDVPRLWRESAARKALSPAPTPE